jgi:hypothetical protein
MQEKDYNTRRDYFAGMAMQALIAKSPFFDKEGRFGNLITEEEEAEFKEGIAKSAWAYADWMLATENQ